MSATSSRAVQPDQGQVRPQRGPAATAATAAISGISGTGGAGSASGEPPPPCHRLCTVGIGPETVYGFRRFRWHYPSFFFTNDCHGRL